MSFSIFELVRRSQRWVGACVRCLTVGEVQELGGSGEHLRGQLLGRRRGPPQGRRHPPRTTMLLLLQRRGRVGNGEILHYKERVMS